MTHPLFRRFLSEANGVVPSKLESVSSLPTILAAPDEVKRAIVEDVIATFVDDDEDPRELMGRYGHIALANLATPLLRDNTLEVPLDYAPRLASACWLAAPVRTFTWLAERHGWTEELRWLVLETPQLAALHEAAFDPLPCPGEAWADSLRRNVTEMKRDARDQWRETLDFFARTPPEVVPSLSWREQAMARRRRHGDDWHRVASWLSLVKAPFELAKSRRPSGLSAAGDHNAAILHGLVATTALEPLSPKEVAALVKLAKAAFGLVLGGVRCTRSPDGALLATPRMAHYLPRLGYRCLNALRGYTHAAERARPQRRARS